MQTTLPSPPRGSFPFIVWCRQRTGSISLFSALLLASEHRAAEMEPFDKDVARDRQFTHVASMSPADRDRALRDICDTPLLIKHCYENLPAEFNRALAGISTRAGYRHIHLYRTNEVARLVSKGIAERHAAWFPCEGTDALYRGSRALPPLNILALKRYHDMCVERYDSLPPLPWGHVATEHLFPHPEAELLRIATFLRLAMRPALLPLMVGELQKHRQNTPSIYRRIPNIDELRRVIA